MNGPIHALILAAGSSSRLNPYIKQLCILQKTHKRLLQHCIDEVNNIGELTSVTCVLGDHSEAVLQKIQIPGHFAVVENFQYHRGLGSSISVGIKSLLSRQTFPFSVLLILGDQPELNAQHLSNLIVTHCSVNHASNITVSEYSPEAFGPPIVFGSNYIRELELLDGDNGAKSIIQRHLDQVIRYQSDYFHGADVDTLEDMKKWGIKPSS